ncbi:MAG: CDF family Co(II)/Ni(II) efflux transporter DmeF [Spirochaetales bacterium]|nr:CDF family Co(II)/Ni(II) efflux transporter DmeF [Spirochaetales bacterium]MCF7939292.1 CDF family Co(II)/Ni(II) efflux transporter DmeF [Spirochaetales bacterium]
MRERTCNQSNGIASGNRRGKRKTLIVVILTAVTMVLEIVFGLITGSLSLLTDGVHMGTHTFALMLTLFAYLISEKNQTNPNFSFSSGKVPVLGGYTNAILLGLIAFLMVKEAVERLVNPVQINFTNAIIVAVLGLAVNLISALVLSGRDGLSGGHGKEEHHKHEDHNLKAAYVHVLTDALTSILAIFALTMGKLFDLTWPDAAVAVIGGAVILRWAYSLLKSTGEILVDYYPQNEDAAAAEKIAAKNGAAVQDLHIWRTSESDKAAVISIQGADPETAAGLKEELRSALELDHITLEVNN